MRSNGCHSNGNGRQPHHRSHQSMESYSDAAAAAAAASCKTDQLLERRKAAAASATANSGQRSNVVAVLAAKDTAAAAAFNLRCLWVGWVFMCWVGGMMTAAGFLLPYWLKGSREASDVKKQLSDLGLFRLCAYPRQVDGQVRLVMDCAHYRHFAEIPSPLWKLAFILMATACCLLLLLTFFLAFTGFRLFILRIRSVVAICGAAQAFS